MTEYHQIWSPVTRHRSTNPWTHTLDKHAESMDLSIAATLSAIEQRMGVTITIVDHHGLLHDSDHRPLIGERWQSHRTQNACDIGFGPRCVAHCRWQIGEQLAHQPGPIITSCWKGLREIACPLRLNERPLGTLFAGIWRDAALTPTARALPTKWKEAWKALLPMNQI